MAKTPWMQIKRKIMFRKILITIGLSSTLLMAQSARDIMQKVIDRDDGDNIITNMQMQLIDKNGHKRVRNMKTYSKDIGVDEYKMIFFISPSDVKNTAFLTYDYQDDDKDDDQWLYLPALKKTKRIPASDKDSAFMGSDFTYNDMTEPNLNDYNFKILKESVVKRKSGNEKVWIIEVLPKNEKVIDETGYLKTIAYVRQDNYMVTRAKYYLKKAKRVKYMDVKKVEKIDGIDVATITTMTTKKGKRTLHKTILIQTDVKMNQNLKKDMFSIRTIEKGL
jgi:hypothetical protein